MFSGVCRLIANHRSSFPSEAYQKQGAFPPSRFRDFKGTIPLSDSRPYQHPKCCGESLPHVRDGSPTLHKALSRHAILITPVDQNRCTYIGFFPVLLRPSPNIGRVGFHIFTFEACSRFTRVTACRFAATRMVYFCLQSFSRQVSLSVCLDSYRVEPIITRTELSSVSALYPRGAPTSCGDLFQLKSVDFFFK